MTEAKVNSAFSGTEFRGETSGVGIAGTDFRSSGGQPEPSAPLHEKDVDFDIPPPPYLPPSDLQHQNVTNQIRPFNTGLTNDDATKALITHVSKSCCMGKNAAKKMEIKNIEYSFIHVLVLETFSEKRQTSWDYKPFRGGHVDDASMGNRVPGVWEVRPSVEPQPFKDGKYTCNMPHTEYIQSCYKCRSTGKIECYMCHSQGSEICSFCNGAGSRDGISCNSCNGRGRKSCFTCNSSGFKECMVCMGSGKLKYFQKLKITWTNHISEEVFPNFIPKDKLKLVTGDVIYKDKNARVFPINYPSLPEITQASQSLITKHEHAYLSKERPLIQQQTVQVIQLATVYYDYNSKPGVYYIFGKESRVHAPSYPSSCCMCTIM